MEHPYQVRVKAERADLKEKVDKLTAMTNHDGIYWTLPTIERLRLRVQLRFMEGYLSILDERISDFQ